MYSVHFNVFHVCISYMFIRKHILICLAAHIFTLVNIKGTVYTMNSISSKHQKIHKHEEEKVMLTVEWFLSRDMN